MTVRILHGDCLDLLGVLDADSIDSCVTDPPYHLASIVKRWSGNGPPPAEGVYRRSIAGFMGKAWDGGDIAMRPDTWSQVLRVLKPGAHLIALCGTRTEHRVASAIEDAGFEIRDRVLWVYGSGFPKSRNISRDLDHARCSCHTVPNVRQVSPSAAFSDQADEGDVLQRIMPQPNLREEAPGSGEYWSAELDAGGNGVAPSKDDGAQQSGMEGRRDVPEAPGELRERPLREMPAGIPVDGEDGRLRHGASAGDGPDGREAAHANGVRPPSGPQAAEQRADQFGDVAGQPHAQAGGAWPTCGRCGKPIIPDGLGTALKPAVEIAVLARKPLARGLTVAENVAKYGTGALNIDACRYGPGVRVTTGNGKRERTDGYGMQGGVIGGSDLGRWPANVTHDGSEEVLAGFPETTSTPPGNIKPSPSTLNAFGEYRQRSLVGHADSGSAARFFYCAKAGKEDRAGSKHPTVKPVALMRWLCRLVTPPGGLILDPFAGSGTTGQAALEEGFRAVLIEQEPEYLTDIRNRIAGLAKAAAEAMPLFAPPAAEVA